MAAWEMIPMRMIYTYRTVNKEGIAWDNTGVVLSFFVVRVWTGQHQIWQTAGNECRTYMAAWEMIPHADDLCLLDRLQGGHNKRQGRRSGGVFSFVGRMALCCQLNLVTTKFGKPLRCGPTPNVEKDWVSWTV